MIRSIGAYKIKFILLAGKLQLNNLYHFSNVTTLLQKHKNINYSIDK